MIRLVPFALLFAVGCSQDFGLQSFEPEDAYGTDRPEDAEQDTAAPDEPEDTAWGVDTGFEPPEEEEPVEEPEEEEPEEEIPYEEEPPEDDCDDTSDRIYVVERDNDTLYIFDPETLRFESQGRISCSGVHTPGSMAVGRDGYAYVRYSDDSVYEVDLTTLGCSSTAYRGAAGFGSFGMGFATEDDTTWRDHLYIADEDSVARLDLSDWSVDVFGGMPSQSELTGNSDGELWAILPLESPASLVRIDKAGGTPDDEIRLIGFPNASDIDTFAFATWGGDFWIFIREYGMGSSTDVYQVSSDGHMTKVLSDVGFDVVGAGVSTCAPSE